MDFSHYGDDTVQIAVDLVNTLNRVNGDDQLTTVSELRAFLDRYPETWASPFKGKLASRHLEEVLELRQSCAFHKFYTDCRILTDDDDLTRARLWLDGPDLLESAFRNTFRFSDVVGLDEAEPIVDYATGKMMVGRGKPCSSKGNLVIRWGQGWSWLTCGSLPGLPRQSQFDQLTASK